jgi:ubiquinol-cytochrome c reductase iron-sulfur subunit
MAQAVAEPTRRDFLYLATAGFAGVGAAAALVPLAAQMNPDASTIATGGPVDFDVSKLAPGQQAMVFWRSRPIFIISRPPSALATLKDNRLIDQLADPDSLQHQQPPYAENSYRSVKPEFAVLVGICTHLGCIPKFFPDPSPSDPAPDWLGGYFCPCHGSKYDLAGHVFKGVPAPYNLPVPPYHFVSAQSVRIGENPPDVTWDFDDIQQI